MVRAGLTLPGGPPLRADVADLLHDEVLQHLAFVRQELLERGDGDDALRSLDSAISSLRRLLTPVPLARAMDGDPAPTWLPQAVRAAVDGAARVGRLRATLELPEATGWSPVVEELLDRAARELVTNVLKHAAASALVVSLRDVDGMAELVVDDDGVGIDLELAARRVRAGHRGLSRLRERVRRLGGDVQLRRTDDDHTVVRVVVPG